VTEIFYKFYQSQKTQMLQQQSTKPLQNNKIMKPPLRPKPGGRL